jgi:hypothetical protein
MASGWRGGWRRMGRRSALGGGGDVERRVSCEEGDDGAGGDGELGPGRNETHRGNRGAASERRRAGEGGGLEYECAANWRSIERDGARVAAERHRAPPGPNLGGGGRGWVSMGLLDISSGSSDSGPRLWFGVRGVGAASGAGRGAGVVVD